MVMTMACAMMMVMMVAVMVLIEMRVDCIGHIRCGIRWEMEA